MLALVYFSAAALVATALYIGRGAWSSGMDLHPEAYLALSVTAGAIWPVAIVAVVCGLVAVACVLVGLLVGDIGRSYRALWRECERRISKAGDRPACHRCNWYLQHGGECSDRFECERRRRRNADVDEMLARWRRERDEPSEPA